MVKFSKLKREFLNCRTYAEAHPILEAMNVSPSAHELARTAFQLRETQAGLKEQFIQTILQEAEDEARKKTKMDEEESEEETEKKRKFGMDEEESEEETEKKKRFGMSEEEDEDEDDDDDDKKTKEYQGGQSQISSKPGMRNLDRQDKDSTHGEKPDDQFEGAQNQMKEMLESLSPELREALVKGLNKMPPMTLKQQVYQMHYMVKEAINKRLLPLEKKVKSLEEASVAIDKKFKEAMSSKQITLDIHRDTPNSFAGRLRESEVDPTLPYVRVDKKKILESRRNEISQLNEAMYRGEVKTQ